MGKEGVGRRGGGRLDGIIEIENNKNESKGENKVHVRVV